MGVRVLATQEAKDCILHMRAVIAGSLCDQIGELHRDGDRLSDPEVWDGPVAAQFRALWPEVQSALAATQRRLDELNRSIDAVTTAILEAGSR
jgi:hypothetical protein